ncbi:tRNA preQ1(34) S-adenosylmethionine ribosyltransferase-isomerase QueA [Candidatus Palauibacter sp.]|uniref:tRNA preQ1(34) S-adenosylmethionine ribosyltransferase-isomerase QueA n=1 Tax=Candidatus Palauibacter sp. TaxID=3101350 RepID=UPI003B5281F6
MKAERAGRTEAYDYELPAELIAARPAERRDASRLLVVDRARGRFTDAAFPALLERLSPGDAVVVNDSRVFPARLLGRKPTGARAEILLVRPEASSLEPTDPFDRADTRLWRAMVRPGGKLKPGRTVDIADGFTVEILDSAPDGTRLVRLAGDADPWTLIQRHGRVPLPPYIVRDAGGGPNARRGAPRDNMPRDDAEDRERYQTVYAAPAGSVAAPTAGLHFTPELLAALEARGARLVRLTLHVGFGTFRPVTATRVEEHRVAPEAYSFSPEAADQLNATRAAGGRVVAIGTTSCRVLETVGAPGRFEPGRGWTDLFIRPPYDFHAVDALVTNFHLPRSSLLMLVAAFAGRELALAAYAHAIRERYRFYSYGDAMLIT